MMYPPPRLLGALVVIIAAVTAGGTFGVITSDAATECREPGSDGGEAGDATVTGTATYRDARVGTDRITLRYDASDAPADFTITLRGVAEVISSEGVTVSSLGPNRYRFDYSTGDRISITYRAYSASADDWDNGVFVAPTHDNATVDLVADGPGIAEEQVMYLGGSYTVESVSNGCETVRIIQPCGVVIEETRADVADSIRSASGSFQVGHRWNETTVVAVEDVRYFGVVGAYFGEGDMVVEADEELDTPANTWVHEYVHARQAYDPVENASWLVEGSAEYYAARLTYEQSRIDREAYGEAVGEAATQPAVLTENETWTTLTPYEQGAVVLTGLDRRIRAADGNHTLQTLVGAINDEARDGDGPVTHADVRRLVRSQGNASTAQWYERVTTNRTIPEVQPTAPGAGLSERDRSLAGAWRASLSDTLDELNERLAHILDPPGSCSRGGLFI